MPSAPYLGLDLGRRAVGVALSESGLLSSPLAALPVSLPHLHGLAAGVRGLVAEHGIRTVVIGIPAGEDGGLSTNAARIAAAAAELERLLAPVEVVRVDEAYSTADAALLYPGVDKDAAAAAVLLRGYLENAGSAW